MKENENKVMENMDIEGTEVNLEDIGNMIAGGIGEHTWERERKEVVPTCIEKGYKGYTCPDCQKYMNE